MCKCGNSYTAVLSDIKRSKNCEICKLRKFKETCMKKYGEDNVSKVPKIFKKILSSSFRSKKFIFPKTKREINVMGYESQAILWILKQSCDPLLYRLIEDEIINDVVTDIVNFSYTNNNKNMFISPIL